MQGEGNGVDVGREGRGEEDGVQGGRSDLEDGRRVGGRPGDQGVVGGGRGEEGVEGGEGAAGEVGDSGEEGEVFGSSPDRG